MSGISSQFEFGSCLDYGSRATVGVGYGPAEDGLRARYAPASGGLYYLFLWDPQGSVQQRHTDDSYTGGYAAYDRSAFEGYGALRQANKGSTGAIVGQHDPVGFGGQCGYHTDTGLLCLTHRYYDPGTGKFLNRDPIGYGGGANLYGFCEGNPVNESDPSGDRPLTSTDYATIAKLQSGTRDAGDKALTASAVAQAGAAIKAAIIAVPTGSPDPPNLKAAFWAINNLGNSRYGFGGIVSSPPVNTIGIGSPKCNIFVANAYAIGAGLGYDGAGVPLSTTGFLRHKYPPVANAYNNGDLKIKHFVVDTTKISVGDIVAFGSSGEGGHVTLYLGGNILIYAGQFNVKLGSVGYVRADGHTNYPVTSRHYAP